MKVIANIATHPGREQSLVQAVNSLRHQVDEINVYDNATMRPDLTDNGKFRFLDKYTEPVYYFSCDSDIIYAPDYVQRMIAGIEKHNAIVTIHGRILTGIDKDYYWGHKSFKFTEALEYSYPIDVAGTGVTAFRTDYFNPTEIWQSNDKKMSDLVFSLEATKQGKDIVILSHEANWCKQADIDIRKTIVFQEQNKAFRQRELANDIWLLKNTI